MKGTQPKNKRKVLHRGQPKPPKTPTTKKEILERIAWLEYRRMQLKPTNAMHAYRIVHYEERLTKEIATLRTKLECLEKGKC